MIELQVIEHQSRRVLTTTQLAESYGAERQLITNNFNRNKNRYKEGKHFISLQGQDKNNFIDLNQIELGSKNAQTLYLWTEKGAWLHAKSLNTDEAWDAYEMLVDNYYEIKEQQQVPSLELALQAALEHERKLNEAERRLTTVEENQENIKQIFSINKLNWRDNANTIINKIAKENGGIYQQLRNKTCSDLETRARVNLKRRFIRIKSEV